MRFVIGDDEIVLGPGGYARVPPSTDHGFEVLGAEPARTLNVVTPGGQWAFFAECGRPAAEMRLPDAIDIPANLPELGARHGGRVVGPPLRSRTLRPAR